MKFNAGDTVRIRNNPTRTGVIKSVLNDGYIILWRACPDRATDEASATIAEHDIELIKSILAQGETEAADSSNLANDPLFW